MKVLSFFVRRVLHSIVVLFGLSIVIFVIARVMPGDPARMSLGFRVSEDAVENLRESMHLDEPLYVQYGIWARDAVRGDFGMSLQTRRDVIQDIRAFFPATLELVLFAGIFTGVGGISLGILAGRYKDEVIDNVVRLFSYLGIVTPSFVFAIIFLLIFGFLLKWVPTVGRISNEVTRPPIVTGLMTIDALLSGNFATFWDALKHLVFPALSLALPAMAQQARITRATMSDNLIKDYIASARTLGIPERVIMGRFLLKPSLIPSVSILGLDIAAFAVNAFLVELVFAWPGLSRYGLTVILRKDLNAISGVILVYGALFILVNVIVDLLIAELDPRIRLSEARGE